MASQHSAALALPPAGGQKVKLVLGAAMWQQPHILVLDEPTNYLDRESLGAMASAIKVRARVMEGWAGTGR